MKNENASVPIADLVASQRETFNSGKTRPVRFRIEQLDRLEKAILARERDILDATKADLGKCDFEAFTTEIVLVLEEIKLMKRKVRAWSKPRRVSAGLFNWPGSGRTYRDPHGVCLVMSPWNYPFMLAVAPLVGAIAAGNTVILKPSAYSPATSAVIASLLRDAFPSDYIACVEGGREVNQDLLAQEFDYIFFTGSVAVGKLVMESASKRLTPVTLELGGKSPCVVDKSADVDLSAKRAAWGKCINSGQTCVAPDYFLVHEDVKDAFVAKFREHVTRFYGENPHENAEFPRIVNRHHFDRLSSLVAGARAQAGRTVTGGRVSAETLKIEPAIIEGVSWDDPVMAEEIFGPIVPVITWRDEDEIVRKILARPRPLALYVFTRDTAQARRITGSIPFGGGCVNDTIMHVATHTLPFGGTGASGMGGYHGKWSFDTFTRVKSVVEKPLWADVPLRYAPFGRKYSTFRKFLG